MESVTENLETETSEELKDGNVPAISLDVVLGYLASLADSLEQISRRIKDDVSGLILQANQDKPEEIHEGDTNDDSE